MSLTFDDKVTEGDLLQELCAAVREAARPRATRLPGDVTTAEIVQASGVSEHKVQALLREKVAAGELVRLYVIGDDGNRTLIYRRA